MLSQQMTKVCVFVCVTLCELTVDDVVEPPPPSDGKVDFLGMSVDGSAAAAGQWVLLVLGLVLLIATMFLAYKYRKARRYFGKSSSEVELK